MINRISVHAGTFHADDVACVSICKMLNLNVEYDRITRVTDLDDVLADDNEIVADIGGGIFDHHGPAAKTRRDGGPHSACTLLWERFGSEATKVYLSHLSGDDVTEVSTKLEDEILFRIADEDNGLFCPGYTLNSIIAQMNPNWDDGCPCAADAAFTEAVLLMDEILKTALKRYASQVKGKEFVQKALAKKQNGVVILEKYVPWKDYVVADPDALVMVFPSNRGGWNIQMVPKSMEGFETRVDTPYDWHGISGLDAEDKVPGMTFCHRNGFLASFRTKENAVAAAQHLAFQKEKRGIKNV